MIRAQHRPLSLALIAVLALVGLLTGCTRLELAYSTGDFFIKRYANGYLDLNDAQLGQWDPRLKAALITHRTQELPYLAGFLDAGLKASQAGFNETNTGCLVRSLQDLYVRQARLVVDTAAPLLAGVTPAQVRFLERRFAEEYAEDRIAPGPKEAERQRLKRANRFRRSIEEWTGPLSDNQRQLIAEIAGRIPNSAEAVLDYRTRKRGELVKLLEAGADEATIRRFLTGWLVDFQDLPPTLTAAYGTMRERVVELLIRLGATLDRTQREHLNTRIKDLRDELMRLQRSPRLAPPAQCAA